MKKQRFNIKITAVALLLVLVAVAAMTILPGSAESYILGDVNSDGAVTILDASATQRTLADIPTGSYNPLAANVDKRNGVTIMDVTYTQRWLAGMNAPEDIGKTIVIPTEAPTAAPTVKPTAAPTTKPTSAPTTKPTSAPTSAPTTKPTSAPTSAPTTKPTSAPTSAPTTKPTEKPTSAPTSAPTTKPTSAPTSAPTTKPTSAPTSAPTTKPTENPTSAPTAAPTQAPTDGEIIHEYVYTMTVAQKFCAIQFEVYYDPDVYTFVDAEYPYFYYYDEADEGYTSRGSVIINDGNNAARAASGEAEADRKDFVPGKIKFNASTGEDMFNLTKGKVLIDLKLRGPASATEEPRFVLKRVADVAISNDDHGQSLPFTWKTVFDGNEKTGSFEGGIIENVDPESNTGSRYRGTAAYRALAGRVESCLNKKRR